jgi:hypothetical protein
MFESSFASVRWVILTLGSGLVFVLAFFVSYLSMRRPRHPEQVQSAESPRPSTWREAWSFVPLILVLVYVGIFVHAMIDIIYKSHHPPNY